MACGHTLVAGSGQGRELLILFLSKFTSSVSVKGASAWGRDSLLWEFGGVGELRGIWKATVNSYGVSGIQISLHGQLEKEPFTELNSRLFPGRSSVLHILKSVTTKLLHLSWSQGLPASEFWSHMGKICSFPGATCMSPTPSPIAGLSGAGLYMTVC